MDDRQRQLLKTIVESYIETAEPVGSGAIAALRDFPYSSATIRNDMMALEELGYLAQPYTSAGRRPTLKGFKYYLDSLMEIEESLAEVERLLAQAKERAGLKGLAKYLADLSDSAVIIGHNQRDLYYTGLARLFGRPEFSDYSMVQELSQLMDQLDQLTLGLFGQFSAEPTIMLGRQSPFGSDCSAIFVSNNKRQETILGLLAPVRTNYQRNLSLLKEAVKYLD